MLVFEMWPLEPKADRSSPYFGFEGVSFENKAQVKAADVFAILVSLCPHDEIDILSVGSLIKYGIFVEGSTNKPLSNATLLEIQIAARCCVSVASAKLQAFNFDEMVKIDSVAFTGRAIASAMSHVQLKNTVPWSRLHHLFFSAILNILDGLIGETLLKACQEGDRFWEQHVEHLNESAKAEYTRGFKSWGEEHTTDHAGTIKYTLPKNKENAQENEDKKPAAKTDRQASAKRNKFKPNGKDNDAEEHVRKKLKSSNGIPTSTNDIRDA